MPTKQEQEKEITEALLDATSYPLVVIDIIASMAISYAIFQVGGTCSGAKSKKIEVISLYNNKDSKCKDEHLKRVDIKIGDKLHKNIIINEHENGDEYIKFRTRPRVKETIIESADFGNI